MFMPRVNYIRVIDCEHDAANKNESSKKTTKMPRENLWKLIYWSIKKKTS